MARCKWIDATVWCDSIGDENEWREKFDVLFDRFAYGRETAPETGRRHFQFRGVLKADLSNDIVSYLASLGFCHITATHVRDFEYVYKERDFYCSWEINRPEFDKVRDSPYVYQVQLEAMERDDRSIEFVVDKAGNSGKTAWGMYMERAHRATYIPPVSRGIDICSCVLNKRVSDWYIVDTPRSFEFNKDWACALEQLKNGYVFDTRNSFKDKYLPCRPRITVLCNELPDVDKYFSADRLQLFEITDKRYLWSV